MFADLIPDPLHPAVVHLPVALAVLLPLFALGALVFIRRGAPSRTAWGLVVAMSAMLTVSSLVAKETGEDQEDRVEKVVPRSALHAHEEAADRFVVIGLVVLAVSALGLWTGRIGTVARGLATVGTIAVLVAGYDVGHEGGKLVYQEGAASAYVTSDAAAPIPDR